MAARFLNSWLPQPVAAQIASEEPERFAATVAGLAADIQAARASVDPDRWSITLRWIPVVKAFLGSKVDYDAAQVHCCRPLHILLCARNVVKPARTHVPPAYCVMYVAMLSAVMSHGWLWCARARLFVTGHPPALCPRRPAHR